MADNNIDYQLITEFSRSVPALSGKMALLSSSCDSLSLGLGETNSVLSNISIFLKNISNEKKKDKKEEDKKTKIPWLDKKIFDISNIGKNEPKESMFEKEKEEFIIGGFSDSAIASLTKIFSASSMPVAAGADAGGGAGLLSKMFGGIFGKAGAGGLMGGLLTGLKSLKVVGAPLMGMVTNPVTWLLAGIVWAAIDAFRGWKMAEKWGTSKTSGALGGLLGGMDKGLSGAMKNMGKWALIGANVGTPFAPVVGTLLGGIIGGVIGAILGWIGGERIAKAFDAVGSWFSAKFDIVMDGVKKMGEFFVDLWKTPKETLSVVIGFLGNALDTFVQNILQFKDIIFGFISNTDIFDDIKNAIGGIIRNIKEFMLDFVNKINPVKWFEKDKESSFIDKERQQWEKVGSENLEKMRSGNIPNVADGRLVDKRAKDSQNNKSGDIDKIADKLSGGIARQVELGEQTILLLRQQLESLRAEQPVPISSSTGVSQTTILNNRDTSAYDAAYELRMRYWSAYTRGV